MSEYYCVVDYSDSNYEEIQSEINNYNYSLPVVAYTPEGYQTVLTDGWHETTYMFQPIKVHHYKLLTYLPDNTIQEDYFGADGTHICNVKVVR